MQTVSQCKTSCRFSFSSDLEPGRRIGECEGLLHLFEQPYDEIIGDFWYGVAELACSVEDFVTSTNVLGPTENLRIHIALEDGRRGLARLLRAHAHDDDGRQTCRMKLFGTVPLSAPR